MYADEIENETDEKYANRLISEMVDFGILDEDDALSEDAEELASERKDDFVKVFTEEQLSNDNGEQFFSDNFGSEELMKLVIKENLLDFDEASKDAVNVDGIAHFLSSYDGETLYLNNDFVAYRVN
jgi:hypothetical protein